jgi:hypothetical protein
MKKWGEERFSRVGCAEQRKEEEKRRKEKKGRGRECEWRIERREEKKRKWERTCWCVCGVGLKSEGENKVIFSIQPQAYMWQ